MNNKIPFLLMFFVFAGLCKSCAIDNRVVLRTDDIGALIIGRTENQLIHSISNYEKEVINAFHEGRYYDAIDHSCLQIDALDQLIRLKTDKYGGYKSPFMFTPQLKKNDAQDDTPLHIVRNRVILRLIEYSLITKDLNGYSRWFSILINSKMVYDRKLFNICIFVIESSKMYYEQGFIDEALNSLKILRQSLASMAYKKEDFWSKKHVNLNMSYKTIDDIASQIMSIYYYRAGDLELASEFSKYLIGNSTDDRIQMSAFLLLCQIKTQIGEIHYAKTYFDQAIALLANNQKQYLITTFLTNCSFEIIEKFFNPHAILFDLPKRIEQNTYSNKYSYQSELDKLYVKNNDLYLNVAWIYKKYKISEKMEWYFNQFESNFSFKISTLGAVCSYAKMLTELGDWDKIIQFYWPHISRIEYYKAKYSASVYSKKMFRELSELYASLAMAIQFSEELSPMIQAFGWPSVLGDRINDKPELSLRFAQFSKTKVFGNDPQLYSLAGKNVSKNNTCLMDMLAGKMDAKQKKQVNEQEFQKWIASIVKSNRLFHIPNQKLEKTQAILEYLTVSNRIMYFYITKKKISIGILESDLKEIIDLTNRVRKACSSPRVEYDTTLYKEAFWKLIPMGRINFDQIETLYISPDSILNQMPMDVIFSTLDDFDNDRIYVYIPSASFLQPEYKRKMEKHSNSLLIGDPLPWNLNMSLAQSKSNEQRIVQAFRSIVCKPEKTIKINSYDTSSGEYGQFYRIPYTYHEVKNIALLFEKKGYKTEIILQEDMTKENLMVRMDGFSGYVHFATHAIISYEIPYLMEPALVITGGNRALDHFLLSSEIEEMDLSGTELVVLSACKTGMDKIIKNEGISGLAKSFFIAGAHNVLMTLWEVDDKVTNLFMQSFYNNLLKGHSFEKSLSNTKKAFQTSKQYNHPFYWGAFVLYGAKI